ncbi:alginate lyase family protein [Salirhabdus sp. Marseille-P4669]|uniref:alginate lyase family protein n=1 Tax=Salirhabdus sp. Marseille-P4669 TaxID=2042310 RepID=UPI000C7B4B75|nr:alginate lyase family protein [Salirhabdus sp. Marseille-P4669]
MNSIVGKVSNLLLIIITLFVSIMYPTPEVIVGDTSVEKQPDSSWAVSSSKYFKVNEENLPVYDNRTGELVEVGQLTKDQVYPRVSDYGANWHKIQYGDIYGYVYAPSTSPADEGTLKNENTNYSSQERNFTALEDVVVYDNTSTELVPFGVINKGTEYPIVSDYGNWWRVLLSDRVGYVHKDAVQVNFKTSDKYFKVSTDNLPVYDNRSGSLVKVGELTKGQVYPRISDYGPNWHKIQFGNIYGYVYADDTEGATGQALKNENKTYSNTERTFTPIEDITVYDNTSGRLVPFGELTKGTEYPIVSDYGNWWRVLLSDRVGYVHKDAVKRNFISEDRFFRVLTGDLSIYDNRSGELIEVGTLTKGQVYPRISDYGPNWHKIQFGNITGYVYSKDTESVSGNSLKNIANNYEALQREITPLVNTPVYDNTSGKLVQFATLKEGKSYPKVKDYGNWWTVVVAGREGYVLKENVKHNFLPGDKFFKVTSKDLPVYDNQGSSLKKIGELRKGQTYPIVSDYGNWWRIQFGDIYGYVHKSGTEYGVKSSIENLNTEYSTSNSKKILTQTNVEVFDNSGGELVPFGELEEGTIYPIAFDYGNWWGIVYSDRVGYISKNNANIFKNDVQAFKTMQDTSLLVKKSGELTPIATLLKGHIFEVYEDYGNWYKVSFGDDIGYVWKEATIPNNTESFTNETPIKFVSTIKETKLYKEQNSKNPVATITGAQQIPIFNNQSEQWIKTMIAGKTVYIDNNYVIDTADYNFNNDENKNIEVIKQHLFDSPFVNDNKNTEINETISAADLILENKILFPDYCRDPIKNDCPMDYTNGINWVSGEGVKEEDQNSFLRQLHGMFFINDLAEAYRMTNNSSYIEKGYEIIQDWKINNPYENPKHYMAWHDEGTARRLSAMVNLFDAGNDVLTQTQKSELFIIMLQHAELLASDNFYSLNTNHGMFQDEALIVYSKYFYDIEVLDEYYQLAVQRLENYFDSLISEDYVHLEHSPSYHEVIAGAIRSYATTIQEFGDNDIANKFFNKYHNMVDYATHVIKPDGNWPLIGDTYVHKKNPSKYMWQDDPYYLYASTKGEHEKGLQPKVTNKVYEDAGYAIFRDKWSNTGDGTYMFFTAAYHTDYHKHSDDLSLWIYNNEDIITESGPYSYLLTEQTTKYAYSSYAHNTLIVDDEGLPRVDGKFNSTYIEEYDLSNENLPSVTGVNERYEGVKHKRSVTYDKINQLIEVNDNITSKNDHNYKLLWHLAPNVIPKINNEENKVLLQKNGETVMEMRITGIDNTNIEINSVFGDEDPIYKSWFFEYNNQTKNLEKLNTYTLIVENNGSNSYIKTSFDLLK